MTHFEGDLELQKVTYRKEINQNEKKKMLALLSLKTPFTVKSQLFLIITQYITLNPVHFLQLNK